MADDIIETKAAPAAARPAPRAAAKAAPAPTPLRLTHLYAYWNDDGGFRTWGAGDLVTDPDEIADLLARRAPVVQEDAE